MRLVAYEFSYADDMLTDKNNELQTAKCSKRRRVLLNIRMSYFEQRFVLITELK